MSLAKSVCDFYKKYKRQLGLFAIVILVYHLYKASFIQEGYSSTQCSAFQNCKECVNNYNAGDPKVPCLWSNDKDTHGNVKGCSAFADRGFSRTCTQPTPGPGPTKCDAISNCKTCTESDCFWGDTDQKCSSTFKLGYGKICSGSNPNPNCPKCEACPNLTLLKTPTFISVQ